MRPVGIAIRACADNLTGARGGRAERRRLYGLTFGIGLACVGAAGALLVNIADASPALAQSYTLLAFVIVIVGGLGSMGGALLGGVLIGVSEALAGFYFAPSMKSMFSFALLVWCWWCGRRACWGAARDRLLAGYAGSRPGAGRELGRVLLAAPAVADRYVVSVLILVFYFAYLGQAWNLMMGLAGQLSLGHALYVGLGGYVAAMLWVHFGIGPWLGVIPAMAIAAVMRRRHRLARLSLQHRGGLFRAADHRLCRIHPHRLRPYRRRPAERAGLFIPYQAERLGEWWNLRGGPLLFYYTRLGLAVGAAVLVGACSSARGWAINGWRCARTSGRRGRSASMCCVPR